jgi:isopenicillin N synthase-like dioxygenase
MNDAYMLGVGGHTDFSAFTILWQDDLGGLEVLNKSGEWVGVPPIEDTFVINIGDLMQVWTNGRFSSTEHRVINRYGKDRNSIAFFVDPVYSTKVEPLVDRSGNYEPVVSGDHIYAQFRRIYPQRKY